MKKALIFIGLILFAGAIIYSTNFIGGGDDNVEEEFGPKRSKEELFLIEKINNIENIEWSKDSIDNLKMSIQISKNFKKISKKAQDDLLSHLENIESKTLQNSFNKWISTSCGSFINSNISQRIHQLSSKRPSDTQLKKYKQGLNSYRLKNQIEREYVELLSIEYNENKKNEIDRLIRNHLYQSTIKNCFVIQS